MLSGRSFRLGRIGGITVNIDYTWFIIFALFVFMLATAYFPAVLAQADGTAHPAWLWGAAVITSVLFFASVLTHELSHSFVARRRGIPINSITLFIFGGVAQMEDEPHTPGDEFKMAIAGPLASIGIGILFIGILAGTHRVLPPLANAALWYLGAINIILAVFNLLPGFPLDGGRVFRSIVWAVTRDLRKATRVASVTGQGFGWLFIILGLASLVVPVLRNYVSVWMALIGWFLVSAARSSYQQVVMRDTLSHVPLRDVMHPSVEAVPATLSVQQLVTDYFLRGSASALPVELNGTVTGVVGVDDVQALPRDAWTSTLVSEIARPITQEQTLHPDDDAWAATNRMAQTDRDRVLVTEGDHVEGIVTRGSILRWLQTHKPGYAPG
jgi:Zn-dependent protease/predicted transcriptional regulator